MIGLPLSQIVCWHVPAFNGHLRSAPRLLISSYSKTTCVCVCPYVLISHVLLISPKKLALITYVYVVCPYISCTSHISNL